MAEQIDFPRFAAADWRRRVVGELAGKTFDQALVHRTVEGFDQEPLYTAESRPEGLEPGTHRAIPPPHHPPRDGWLIGQELAQPRVVEVAATMATDLSHGARLFWLRCGGFAPRSRPGGLETTTADRGVCIADVDDAEELLEGLGDEASVVLDLGAEAIALGAVWVASAQGFGFAPGELRGSFACDPLAELARRGRLACSLPNAFRQMVDLVAWTTVEAPEMRSVLISTRPYHEAGCHRAQELAFALATGAEYLRRMTEAGIPLDTAAKQIEFAFCVGGELFPEIAKLRAARRLWAKVIHAWGGGEDADSMVIHAHSSAREASRLAVQTNLLRSGTQGFAAAIGGADTIIIAPHDEATGRPSDSGRRLAVDVQHLLMEEAHLGRVIDPGGGSWYLESLTEVLGRDAWTLFREIEGRGGMAQSLLDGRIAREVAQVADERQRQVRTQQQLFIGASIFADLSEGSVDPQLPERDERESESTPGAHEDRRLRNIESLLDEALDTIEQDRNEAERTEAGLTVVELSVAAPGQLGELMEVSIAAAAAGAQTQDIAARLRAGSEPAECPRLEPVRLVEPFEELRFATERWVAEHGSRPRASIIELSDEGQISGQAGFVSQLLATAGIESEQPTEAPGTPVVVLCGRGAIDPESVAARIPKLRKGGASCILVAGQGGEHQAGLESAGVDGFIYRGCDAYSVLSSLLESLGVLP